MKKKIKEAVSILAIIILQFTISCVVAEYFIKVEWTFWDFLTDPATIAFWGTIILFELIRVLWIWFRHRRKAEKEDK